MFTKRRPISASELEDLVESFGVPSEQPMLAEAEVSEVATVAELGALHTVLVDGEAPPRAERHRTVAQIAASWSVGGGDRIRDQESFWHAVARAADPAFAPELLLAPTTATSSGWWIIDGIHRAAGLYHVRSAAGATHLGLRVFVLPRPV